MRNQSLLAALSIAMVAGLSEAQMAMPTPRKGSSRDYTPSPPRMDSELAREIAAHNEKVGRKKAEKKAKKLARQR